ncbi:hypothetical protein NDU88_005082 [Pleurodeles waltl]|uniref:Uncharacterized protein n=1 Tax=Pleurodeles waltl TaxID=8319 RepID=A0AAV7V2X8_PLEWA|nr:hypothetical protein NDU88_005082 [Pleurodeles waltl]
MVHHQACARSPPGPSQAAGPLVPPLHPASSAWPGPLEYSVYSQLGSPAESPPDPAASARLACRLLGAGLCSSTDAPQLSAVSDSLTICFQRVVPLPLFCFLFTIEWCQEQCPDGGIKLGLVSGRLGAKLLCIRHVSWPGHAPLK